MNELRILGDLDLHGPDGNRLESILDQPKRLAILAYLALASPRGFQRRDLLIAVFWPELDEAHSRNSLNQSLHRLRRALGAETVVSHGTDEVGIDANRLSCDALAFDEAVEAGEFERALELYRGDLLNGLFISGAPEFERWLDAEREQRRRKAFDAALALGLGAEDGEDSDSAAHWYRRALTIMPEQETAVRRLMAVLARAGDPAGAVELFDRFASRLEEDYGLQPSDEARAIVDSIRTPLAAEEAQPLESRPVDRQALAQELIDALVVLDARGQPVRRRSWSRRVGTLVVGLAVLVLGVIGVRRVVGNSQIVEADLLRVAVLPFENMGGNPEDGYFADGLHNEVLTRLYRIGSLKVVSRTSVLEYRDSPKNLRTIAEELGVQTVMEASVQRSGDRVRINAQLIDARTDEHLWADVYDRELTAENLFDVQGSIALDVARALRADLSAHVEMAATTPPTENLQAYEFYLRGRSLWGRFYEGGYQTAVEMFEKAVELDSTFASAYAWLGFARANVFWYTYPWGSSEDLAEGANGAAQRALELAPDLAETHLALGTVHYYVRRDYGRALEEYEIALESWPNSAELFLMTASVKRRQGDFLAARDDFATAADLDRNFAVAATELAETDRFLRDFATSERHYIQVIATHPDLTPAYEGLAKLYIAWNGQQDRARAALEDFPGGRTGEFWLTLAWLDVERAERDYQALLERLNAGPETLEWQGFRYPRPLLVADVLARMDRPELALTSYDSARVIIESWLDENPDDPRVHGALGIALAGLGRHAEAVREGKMAVDLLPLSKDAMIGTAHVEALARIYAMAGQYDAAIDQLELLLSRPGPLSAAWLRVDPTWDPLRDQPRFRVLAARGP